MLPLSPAPARFPDIARLYRGHLPRDTQDPTLSWLLRLETEQDVLIAVHSIFAAFVIDETIYNLEIVRLGLFHLIDEISLHLNELRNFESLGSSAASAKKHINAQRTIYRIYEVSKRMLLNLAENIRELLGQNTSQLVRAAVKYIQENYSEDLSLTDIASRLYISPAYLSKIFSAEIGQPFSRYILEYRVKKSVELLADPTLKIYDIANLCGFADIAHFSKSFKQMMGTSPHKYRNIRET